MMFLLRQYVSLLDDSVCYVLSTTNLISSSNTFVQLLGKASPVTWYFVRFEHGFPAPWSQSEIMQAILSFAFRLSAFGRVRTRRSGPVDEQYHL